MKRESRTVDRSHQVDSPAQRHLPLVDLLVDTRAELMELAVASGLKVLHDDARRRIGRRSAGRGISIRPSARRRAPGRSRARSCSAAGRSQIRRPRVRADGEEVAAADVSGVRRRPIR